MEDMANEEYSDSEQMVIHNTSVVSLFRYVLFGRLFKTPRNTSKLTGAQKTKEWLEGHPVRFYEQLRVDKHTFYLLRDALCERNLLKNTKQMDVNEQLVIFLHTIGHNVRNRVLQDRFQHSGETISRHFKRVLKSINGLCDVCITNPANEVPTKILGDERYYPYFKIYCPYRGDRYHIGSFRGTNRRYISEKDLFNHLHAQLQNVVERTFGVLKARFPILTRNGGIPYPYKKQVQIVMACCIIHNFITKVDGDDELFQLYEQEGTEGNVDTGDQQVRGQANLQEDDQVAGERLRAGIGQQLWTNHQRRTTQEEKEDD